MAQEIPSYDADDSPDVLRLAEEVARSRQPRALTHNGEVLAVIRPAGRARRRRHPPVDDSENPSAWLVGLIGIGASGEPADVSGNVHHDIAEAIYSESHGSENHDAPDKESTRT